MVTPMVTAAGEACHFVALRAAAAADAAVGAERASVAQTDAALNRTRRPRRSRARARSDCCASADASAVMPVTVAPVAAATAAEAAARERRAAIAGATLRVARGCAALAGPYAEP